MVCQVLSFNPISIAELVFLFEEDLLLNQLASCFAARIKKESVRLLGNCHSTIYNLLLISNAFH